MSDQTATLKWGHSYDIDNEIDDLVKQAAEFIRYSIVECREWKKSDVAVRKKNPKLPNCKVVLDLHLHFE